MATRPVSNVSIIACAPFGGRISLTYDRVYYKKDDNKNILVITFHYTDAKNIFNMYKISGTETSDLSYDQISLAAIMIFVWLIMVYYLIYAFISLMNDRGVFNTFFQLVNFFQSFMKFTNVSTVMAIINRIYTPKERPSQTININNYGIMNIHNNSSHYVPNTQMTYQPPMNNYISGSNYQTCNGGYSQLFEHNGSNGGGHSDPNTQITYLLPADDYLKCEPCTFHKGNIIRICRHCHSKYRSTTDRVKQCRTCNCKCPSGTGVLPYLSNESYEEYRYRTSSIKKCKDCGCKCPPLELHI